MTIHDFVKFCKDLKVLTRRFTSVQAENIFRKSVAKLQSLEDGNPLKDCLFYDKRINFLAFRSIAVVMLAKERSMTLDEFMGHILPNIVELLELAKNSAPRGS